MKRNLLGYVLICLVICFLVPLTVFGQTNISSDTIIGKWLDKNLENGNTTIEFYKDKGKYFADIIDLKDKYKLDENNPYPVAYNRRLLGCTIIKDLEFKYGVWQHGTFYDPKSGKTYTCEVSMVNEDTLKIRGDIGVSFATISETLTRVD